MRRRWPESKTSLKGGEHKMDVRTLCGILSNTRYPFTLRLGGDFVVS